MDSDVKIVLGDEFEELSCVSLEFFPRRDVIEQCRSQYLDILGRQS